MTSRISKGGFQRPTRTNDNVNILLVGSRMSDGDEIRRELGIIPGFNYTTWYCSDLSDALDFLRTPDRKIDLIFLDLSLFNADYPKEYFTEVKNAIPETPIVVLTDRTDFDLIEYVMAGGAAENISQWQIRNDPDRLRGLVESCCARDKLSRASQAENATRLQDEKNQGALKLRQAEAHSAEFLTAMQHKNAADTKTMVAENLKLKAEKTTDDIANGKKIHDAEEALGRSEAELNALRASSAAAATQSQAAYATNLKRLGDENVRLNTASGLHATSLKAMEDQHTADLAAANTKSDAVLQYVQKKSAIDMKKVKEENAGLRNENSHVRDWMSGGYSAPAGSDTPVITDKPAPAPEDAGTT
jgi:DNA-binding NarL/FixJ family response regulator